MKFPVQDAETVQFDWYVLSARGKVGSPEFDL
jgi:hypothetical protein